MQQRVVLVFVVFVVWFAPAAFLTAADWQWLRAPGDWEKARGGIVEAHDGYAWYRCFVRIPESWRGQEIVLYLGRIHECDETFLNGVKIGASGSLSPFRKPRERERQYQVDPGAVNFGGENLLAVRVYGPGGTGGLHRGPLRLRSVDGTIELSGRWQFHIGDDLSSARWPEPPGSEKAVALAREFHAESPDIGKLTRATPLAGTSRLELTEDIASRLVAGVDRFLLRKTAESVEGRESFWQRDTSSWAQYEASVEPQRQRLARILGAHDPRVPCRDLEVFGTTEFSGRVLEVDSYSIHQVRWPVLGDMLGEGLLLTPTSRPVVAQVIAVPDADQTPEMLVGLAPGVPPESQFARRLAESGCRVVVPTLIHRGVTHRRLTDREYLYRSAFELGRHLIGYEVQKVRAVVDWFEREAGQDEAKTAVIGWGEGGLIALHAAALDRRIDVTCVSGYFDAREDVWQEPIYRNVFGLLEQFGDAEIASLVAPRTLIVEAARGPELVVPPGTGGGPGRLVTPELGRVRRELERARALLGELEPGPSFELVTSGKDGRGPFGSVAALESVLRDVGGKLAPPGRRPEETRPDFDPAGRQRRQFHEIDRHNQWLLRESPFVRKEFLSRLDTRSLGAYVASAKWYREYFYGEVIGRFDETLLDPNVRTRKVYDEIDLEGYEVVLDVFPDVIAHGLLLLPKGLAAGERRPVVVCQHGLEGRPRDVADPYVANHSYNQYAVELTRRGFITFSPQNLYIFRDRFRTLQRKGNPLKKTLFSVIVPQHQQIVDWLASLPQVDPERIAFYGLSYGGKSAMRIPPLVDRYCLSICSADFNEWVDKNASTRNPRSYVRMGEYEIFEFDLGGTFNYMEMAALIAPRPFMVERGHFDGVADDQTVAYEFAKVRFLYAARLKIPERCEIEWFDGPHTIHGKGTFEFLHRHLDWPKR